MKLVEKIVSKVTEMPVNEWIRLPAHIFAYKLKNGGVVISLDPIPQEDQADVMDACDGVYISTDEFETVREFFTP